MLKKNIIIYSSIFALLIIYILLSNQFKLYIPCPIYKLTGYYCPGCGITRMLNSLIHLEFYQAFRYNAFIFILFPIFILYFILQLRSHYTNKDNIMNTKQFNKFWYILIILAIIFGIIRNIPLFAYLAPIKI